MSLKYEEITEDIIGSAFEIYNILGYGLLEKVYQKTLPVDMRTSKIQAFCLLKSVFHQC